MNKPVFAAIVAAVLGYGIPACAEGIYLRADVGRSASNDHDYQSKANSGIGGNISGQVSGDLGDSTAWGGGLGYQFNKVLRADATYMRRTGFEVDGLSANNQQYNVDVENQTLMLTAYLQIDGLLTVDLHGFQPYVGAGVGMARNKTDERRVNAAGVSSAAPGETVDEFAWHLTAGSGYAVTPNIVIDLGYRYLDAGKFSSPAGNVTVGGAVVAQTNGSEGDLTAHEVTLGLRYTF